MPVYEYENQATGEVVEHRLPLSAPRSYLDEKGHTWQKVIRNINWLDTTKKKVYHTLEPDPIALNYAEKKRYLKQKGLEEGGDAYRGSKADVSKSMLADQRRERKKEKEKALLKAFKRSKQELGFGA